MMKNSKKAKEHGESDDVDREEEGGKMRILSELGRGRGKHT